MWFEILKTLYLPPKRFPFSRFNPETFLRSQGIWNGEGISIFLGILLSFRLLLRPSCYCIFVVRHEGLFVFYVYLCLK